MIYNENAARYTCNSLTGFECMDAVGYTQMITNTRLEIQFLFKEFFCTIISIINCPYLKLFSHFYRGWNCDDCIREVGLIATQYSLPHISHHWKNYLSHQGKIINRHVTCIKLLKKYLVSTLCEN